MGCELAIGSTNPLKLAGLSDAQGFVNDAVVLVSVGDLAEYQDQTMEYVEDSDGVYSWDLPDDADLDDGEEYVVTMVATWTRDGDPFTATFSETYTAVLAGRQFGPDVYATCDDLHMLYGQDNIEKWSDLDNEADPVTMRDRQNWALHLASRQMDDYLRGSAYVIPFQLPYPATLIDQTARLAGVLLYEGPRGLADADGGDHPLRAYRDQVEMWVSRVLTGRIRLNKTQTSRVPGVVKGSTSPTYPRLTDDTVGPAYET